MKKSKPTYFPGLSRLCTKIMQGAALRSQGGRLVSPQSPASTQGGSVASTQGCRLVSPQSAASTQGCRLVSPQNEVIGHSVADKQAGLLAKAAACGLGCLMAAGLAGCSHQAQEPKADAPYIMIGAQSAAPTDWTPLAESRGSETQTFSSRGSESRISPRDGEPEPLEAELPLSIGVYGFNSTADKGNVFSNTPMYRIGGALLEEQPWYDPANFLWYDDNLWAYENPVPWLRSTAANPIYYKFYGYAPYRSANVDVTIPTYQGIQRFTLSELPRFSTEDVVVADNIVPYTAKTASQGANPWQTLRMRHLYCRVRFCFKLGEHYSDLRLIHLKQLELVDAYDMPLQATVTFNQNALGDYMPPTISWTADASRGRLVSVTLRNEKDAEYVVISKNDPDYTAMASLYLYPGEQLREVRIRVTYDVYDVHEEGGQVVQGQLLRKDDSVTNLVPVNLSASGSVYGAHVLEAGYYFNCNIKVQPTFLYALSDNDNDYDGYLVIKE